MGLLDKRRQRHSSPPEHPRLQNLIDKKNKQQETKVDIKKITKPGIQAGIIFPPHPEKEYIPPEGIQLEIDFNPMNVSIIIPAYKAKHFLEECLDSIQKQTHFKNSENKYEILLGIDNCKETLNRALEIKSKYKNLNIFMMDENVGPYIVKNTLIPLVKYDHILFFDADDIMNVNMIQYLAKYSYIPFVRFRYKEFIVKNNKREYISASALAHGVTFCQKSLLNNVGGFQSWRCSADTEFFSRIEKFFKHKHLQEILFYRRNHNNSLTRASETNMRSKIRKEYSQKCKELKNKYNKDNIKIIPTTIKYCKY